MSVLRQGRIGVACGDLLGKAYGEPIAALLGGGLQEDFPLYEAVPVTSPAQMDDFVVRREEAGTKRFQLKLRRYCLGAHPLSLVVVLALVFVTPPNSEGSPADSHAVPGCAASGTHRGIHRPGPRPSPTPPDRARPRSDVDAHGRK